MRSRLYASKAAVLAIYCHNCKRHGNGKPINLSHRAHKNVCSTASRQKRACPTIGGNENRGHCQLFKSNLGAF